MIISYLKSNKEYFSGPVLYDLGAYLAAYEEYKRFYEDSGKTVCKQVGAAEPLCSAYGGVPGTGYVFSPPILRNGQNTMRLLGDADFSGVPITGAADVALERAVFTYYCARPTTFDYASSYNTKTIIERYIDENCHLIRSDVAISGYILYMTINGKHYEVRKAFTGVRDVLGCAKVTTSGQQLGLFAGVGIEAPSKYGRWFGGAGEEGVLFTLLLKADSKKELDDGLKPPPAFGSASASSGPTGGVGVEAGNLQLPAITYLPDARLRNKQLFDAMYNSIQKPSASLKTYYKNANITASTDTYVATVAKFIQLDKWILAGATVGNIVDSSLLLDKSGVPYNFKVPLPYDPSTILIESDKETAANPLESAVDLKSYELQGAEADIMTYFKTVRRYESPAMKNAAIAEKLREGICASAGYYTNTTAPSKCKCTTGCCIPVAYKAKSSCLAAGAGGAKLPITSAGLSSDSQAILGKVDNCVHMRSQFKLVRGGPTIRIGPTPTCIETSEGFVDLPGNYGGARSGIKIKGQIQELKGWAISPLGRAV